LSYVIGCPRDGVVYLVADTAVTRGQYFPKPSEYTSFGEREVNERGRAVQEGALKLVRAGPMMAAVTGDLRSAARFLGRVRLQLQAGHAPRQALNLELTRLGPVQRQHHFVLLCAWPERPVPALCGVEPGRDIVDVEPGTSCATGSLRETDGKHLSDYLLLATANKQLPDAERRLVAAIAAIQNFGIHNGLLAQHVGGTFTGAAIGADGIRWQKRLLFLFHDDGVMDGSGVLTRVYDDVLVIGSSITRTNLCLTNDINCPDAPRWFEKWGEVLRSPNEFLNVDYMILQNTRRPSVAVVEALGHTEGASFGIEPGRIGVPEDLRADANLGLADGHCRLNWYPFRPPGTTPPAPKPV
jgi:hypothetical protein